MKLKESYSALPGGDLVAKGIHDLCKKEESIESLLVLMADVKLRQLGFQLPELPLAPNGLSPEFKLYTLLEHELGDGAHSRYNALRRRLASFLRGAACVPE